MLIASSCCSLMLARAEIKFRPDLSRFHMLQIIQAVTLGGSQKFLGEKCVKCWQLPAAVAAAAWASVGSSPQIFSDPKWDPPTSRMLQIIHRQSDAWWEPEIPHWEMCEMLRACSLAGAAAVAAVLQMPHSVALCRTYFQLCARLLARSTFLQTIVCSNCAPAHGLLHNHILCLHFSSISVAHFCAAQTLNFVRDYQVVAHSFNYCAAAHVFNFVGWVAHIFKRPVAKPYSLSNNSISVAHSWEPLILWALSSSWEMHHNFHPLVLFCLFVHIFCDPLPNKESTYFV